MFVVQGKGKEQRKDKLKTPIIAHKRNKGGRSSPPLLVLVVLEYQSSCVYVLSAYHIPGTVLGSGESSKKSVLVIVA